MTSIGWADKSIDPVTEFQDAALNYESAAKSQMTLANSLLRSREADNDEEEPEQRRRRRDRNASLKMQTVNHLMGAAGNLDHATRAWRAAAQAARDSSSREYFQQAGQEVNRRATALIQRAAALAEHAALEHGATGNLQQQSNASHRAGRIREQLAGRR